MRNCLIRSILFAALTLVLLLGVSTTASAGRWTDLPESVTAKYGITEDQIAEFSEGFNGTWKPWQDISRAQFVKMAVGALHIRGYDPDEPSFTDVAKDSLYYPYVEGAKAAGLVQGRTATIFAPDDLITRQEALAIIARKAASAQRVDLAAKYADGGAESILGNFTDAARISASLQAELAYAYEYGITQGTGEGTINPLADLWRIQAAAMLVRSQPLTGPPMVSTPATIATAIGGKLLGALGDQMGPTAFGWVLTALGLEGLIPPDTTALLQQVTQQLFALSGQMDDLQDRMNGVAYNDLALTLAPVVSAVETAQQMLSAAAGSGKNVPQAQLDEIYNLIGSQILPNKNLIRNAMLGRGGLAYGLIESWSWAVAGSHHFFSKADSDAQRAMYNYWMDLQAVQEQLIFEYYHYRGYTAFALEQEFDEYVQAVQAQRAMWPLELSSRPGTSGVYVVQHAGRTMMMNAHVAATQGPLLFDGAANVINRVNAGVIENYGRTNWRLPSVRGTRLDMPVIFKYPLPGNDARTWMAQQGWGYNTQPAVFVEYDHKGDIVLWGETGDPWLCGPNVGWNNTWAHVFPVRDLAPDEFYFFGK